MPYFELLCYVFIYSLSLIFPISSNTHDIAFYQILHWESAPDSLKNSVLLGIIISLIFYYRHDVLSIVSNFLKLVFTFKKPQSIDEWLFIFILLSYLPYYFLRTFLNLQFLENFATPIWMACSMLIFTFPLVFAEKRNRKSQRMIDWSWTTVLFYSVIQSLSIIPGVGRQTLALTAAFGLNFRSSAALKFVLLSYLPFLIHQYFSPQKSIVFSNPDTSFLSVSFYALIGVGVLSFLIGLVTINYLNKILENHSLNKIMIYRIAASLFILYYFLFYKAN